MHFLVDISRILLSLLILTITTITISTTSATSIPAPLLKNNILIQNNRIRYLVIPQYFSVSHGGSGANRFSSNNTSINCTFFTSNNNFKVASFLFTATQNIMQQCFLYNNITANLAFPYCYNESLPNCTEPNPNNSGLNICYESIAWDINIIANCSLSNPDQVDKDVTFVLPIQGDIADSWRDFYITNQVLL